MGVIYPGIYVIVIAYSNVVDVEYTEFALMVVGLTIYW